MNAAASRRLAGRPGALVRFHALFNTGALIGAATAGAGHRPGVSWRWLWPTSPSSWRVAVGDLGCSRTRTGGTGTHRRRRRRAARAGPTAHGPSRRLRVDGLLVFLVVFALAEITEGGVDTWGVLYLRTHLAAGVLLGAGAYVVGQSVAATTRGAGGPLLGPPLRPVGAGGRRPAWPAAASCSSRSRRRRRSPPSGWPSGPAGASLFWPLVMSQVSRQASRPTAPSGPSPRPATWAGWPAPRSSAGSRDTSGLARGLQLLALASSVVAACALPRRGPAQGPAEGAQRARLAPTAMILPRIETPADLRPSSHDELAELARRSGPSSSSRSPPPAATSAPTWAWSSSPSPCTGSSTPPRRHPVGHRPPGLRAQAADRPPLRLPDPAAGGRHVGLPQPGRVRARLDREQPRLDRPLLRPRAGHGF